MAQAVPHPVRFPPSSNELVIGPGEEMSSERHLRQMMLLIDSLELAWRSHTGSLSEVARPSETLRDLESSMGKRLPRLCLGLLLAGCGPSPGNAHPPSAPGAVSVTPPTSPPPSLAPSTGTPSRSPLVAPPDAVCRLAVTRLEPAPGDHADATLMDVLASTPLVTVVVPVLDAPDCSGIGWRHLAFEPFDPARSEGLIRAYRSMHLPASAPVDAPYYLMGGTFDAVREVDLKKVCVPFKSQVNARAEWVLPLRDRADAAAWNERLSRGVCGHRQRSCQDCANDCGGTRGCCRVVEDSCAVLDPVCGCDGKTYVNAPCGERRSARRVRGPVSMTR